MKCKVCGQRHINMEEAARAHTPRAVPLVPVHEPKEELSDISKAEDKKETTTVKYRGREYTGVITNAGVEIALKSGQVRTIPLEKCNDGN